MTTHSSVLALTIPWAEEPGRLCPWGHKQTLSKSPQQLIYNAVLVSAVQQSESVMHIHISTLFQILFPYRLLQSIESSSLCCTASPYQLSILYIVSFPGGSEGKESGCNEGGLDLIAGLGRSLGEGNGYPLEYSYLENPMDRRAWWAIVHGSHGVRYD